MKVTIRKCGNGEFDELFVTGFVHIERMDTRAFWIGIDTPGGQIHVRTGVEKGVWFFNIEQEFEDGRAGEDFQVERPACHRKHVAGQGPSKESDGKLA